jgi:hypothetical protein
MGRDLHDEIWRPLERRITDLVDVLERDVNGVRLDVIVVREVKADGAGEDVPAMGALVEPEFHREPLRHPA